MIWYLASVGKKLDVHYWSFKTVQGRDGGLEVRIVDPWLRGCEFDPGYVEIFFLKKLPLLFCIQEITLKDFMNLTVFLNEFLLLLQRHGTHSTLL